MKSDFSSRNTGAGKVKKQPPFCWVKTRPQRFIIEKTQVVEVVNTKFGKTHEHLVISSFRHLNPAEAVKRIKKFYQGFPLGQRDLALIKKLSHAANRKSSTVNRKSKTGGAR